MPDSKRRQTRPKQRGEAASQFCRIGNAKAKRLTRSTSLSLAIPSASAGLGRVTLTQARVAGAGEREPRGKK